jgi:formylglycine-generating enzyme required for sulfatase activity
MKIITSVLFWLTLLSTQAQKKKDIPPDFEWVKERGLLVARTETTVKQWVEYMEAVGEVNWQGVNPTSNPITDKCVCANDGIRIKILNPDAINFRDTTFVEVDSKKGKKTRSEVKCSNMPVTGVSLDQAKAYADWLTEKYAADNKYAGLNLSFRLPTSEEMDSLLSDIFGDFKSGQENYDTYKNGINSHGCAIYNHAHNSWCDNNKNMKLRYGYGIPMETNLFFPDWNGLYDLMGNVAEMTTQEGVAKGGSCMHPASACQPGAEIKYEEPQWWLGFRLVAALK